MDLPSDDKEKAPPSTDDAGAASGNPPGVLRCGTLEKPHGMLGKWVKRYYVLTEDCLHRFARANSDMFFGKEIAHYDLEFVKDVRVQGNTIRFDLVQKGRSQREKRKIKCPTGLQAEEWVVGIKNAQKAMIIRRRDSTTERPRSGSGGGTPRRRRSSITGDYQKFESPLRFGSGGNNNGLHLPSPFSFRIQQTDGTTASKGNSLVPDEEQCCGGVMNDSILVVEDTSGRSVRLALSDLANVSKCEKTLELKKQSRKGKGDGKDADGKSLSVDDDMTNVSLRIRFESDRRDRGRRKGSGSRSSGSSGSSGSGSGSGSGGDSNVHNFILGVSVLVVVASSVFLVKLSEDLQGPVGIWATCMVVGTAVLGLLGECDIFLFLFAIFVVVRGGAS